MFLMYNVICDPNKIHVQQNGTLNIDTFYVILMFLLHLSPTPILITFCQEYQ